MKLLNICLASHEYPPETAWGGIATYTYILSHALARKGHDVHVITMSKRKNKDLIDDNVYVHRIKYKKLISGGFWNQINYSWKIYKTLNRLLKENSIEIMECPEYYTEGFFSSKIKKIPLIVKAHTPIFFLSQFEQTRLINSLDNLLVGKLEKSQIKSANKVTSCSFALAKIISKHCSIDLDQIQIVPNGINIERFDQIENDFSFRSRYGIEETDIVLLYLGRLEKKKGIYVLAKVIPKFLKNFKHLFFVFVGRDDAKRTHEQEIKTIVGKRFDNRLIFTGFLSSVDKIKAIKACDLMVVPSFWENFGYVCLEAMACKKPVIGTKFGGITEIIMHGKNGLLFNPYCIKELEKLIGLLVKNEEMRIKLGKNARRTIEMKFTDEKMANKTLKVYEEVLS